MISSNAITIAKRTESAIIIGRLIGICISGSYLFRVDFFAFRAIRSIRAPVAPPEMTPPIPSMRVKSIR